VTVSNFTPKNKSAAYFRKSFCTFFSLYTNHKSPSLQPITEIFFFQNPQVVATPAAHTDIDNQEEIFNNGDNHDVQVLYWFLPSQD